MFETLRNALKVKDIRKRLLFTLVVLIICRLGSQLPIPGIDTDTISQYLNSLLGDSFNLLNSFTGGSFESMSLFALNVTPYHGFYHYPAPYHCHSGIGRAVS